MAVERISCCVPFCRRTRHNRESFSEWVCRDHWMAVSSTKRQRYYKLRRRYRRRFGDNGFWAYPAGSPDRIEAVRLDKLLSRAWQTCRILAIERAAGI